MATLIGIVVMGVAVILQTTIVSQVPLLHGPADLVLVVLVSWVLHREVEQVWPIGLAAGLLVGIATALPLWVPLLGYGLVSALTGQFKRWLWQVQLLSLFATTLLGSLLVLGLSYAYLQIAGTPIPFGEAFNQVVLPSVLLNLILVLPVYGLISELTKLVYPAEVEV